MDDIINSLEQEIEQGAFPYFYAKGEYRQEQDCVLKEAQWLQENLSNEERSHLEQLRAAELRIAALEGEAQIKIAVAVGIRLALCC